MAIFRWGPPNGIKKLQFSTNSGFWIDDCSSVECLQQFQRWSNLQH